MNKEEAIKIVEAYDALCGRALEIVDHAPFYASVGMDDVVNLSFEGDDVVLVSIKRKYYACPKCIVTYGKDRYGNTFFPNEAVYIKPGFHPGCDGRVFIITGIFIFEECESADARGIDVRELSEPADGRLDVLQLLYPELAVGGPG